MTKQKMTKGYKYMMKCNRTTNGVETGEWGDGVTQDVTQEVEGDSWSDLMHFYVNKYIASLLDPVQGTHVYRKDHIMRTCVAEGKIITNDGLIFGTKKLTTGRKVKPITLSMEQRIECAIRISLLVYDEPSYIEWAEMWLSGECRREYIARVARKSMRKHYDANVSREAYRVACDATKAASSCIWTTDPAYYTAYCVYSAVEAGVNIKEITKIIKSVLEKVEEK